MLNSHIQPFQKNLVKCMNKEIIIKLFYKFLSAFGI